MSRGNGIIVSAEPGGRFDEGTISGALKPGTCLQIKASSGIDDNGRFTYEVYAPGTDGEQRQVIVLLPDDLSGKLATTAYADGDHCFVYEPANGDELNMLLKDISGTGDDHTIGETLMIDTGTGKLIATTGSPESEPFRLLETITDPTADQLVHCVFTGY